MRNITARHKTLCVSPLLQYSEIGGLLWKTKYDYVSQYRKKRKKIGCVTSWHLFSRISNKFIYNRFIVYVPTLPSIGYGTMKMILRIVKPHKVKFTPQWQRPAAKTCRATLRGVKLILNLFPYQYLPAVTKERIDRL